MTLANATTSPAMADLVDRAAALVPVLRARADACEAGNKVPDETIRDFQEAASSRFSSPAAMADMRWTSKPSTRCR